ncbi:MAG: DAK2 domain-containing protein [Propionibacteriaceae bacterium]|jgi:dihydroxyacetone kinase-like protein|nr:DAK2 domain-containing protein [Propionibacteriaceae bacterium]
MLLDKNALSAMLREVAGIWLDNVGSFNEIDSRFGDGDHGVTIGKIAGRVNDALDGWDDQSLKDFFHALSSSIMAVGGGSAGPLYGMVFEGFSEGIDPSASSIDAAGLKAMFTACRDAMGLLTKAKVGDKTMMDALLPAIAAAEECGGDVPEILAAAAAAAAEGAQATTQMVSKFGRARSYGEQTLGTPDAGALSTALLFQGFSQAVA